MKGQMDTQYGKILIDEDVIATYAGSVAVECFGIVGMAAVNMKDGLGEFGIFTKIFIPTMKSTYAAAIIVTFMTSWNNYMWPLISLQSPEKKTLPLILSALGSSYTPDYGMMMVAVVIATIPTALIFFLMQKNFVQGMTGSVKG